MQTYVCRPTQSLVHHNKDIKVQKEQQFKGLGIWLKFQWPRYCINILVVHKNTKVCSHLQRGGLLT